MPYSIIIMKMIKPVTAVADVVNVVRCCFVSLVCVKPLCYWSSGFFHSSSWKTLPWTWCSLIVSVKRNDEGGENSLKKTQYLFPLCVTCVQ